MKSKYDRRSNMSKKNGNGKKDADRLFAVAWVERVIVEAHIWAKSPEEAKEKAEHGSLQDLVAPYGYFHDVIPGTCEINDEIEDAAKKDYKSGGIYCVEIHY
jgi:hypothetical protein